MKKFETDPLIGAESLRARLLALGKDAETIELAKLDLVKNLAHAMQEQGDAANEDDAIAKAFDAVRDQGN